MHGFICFTHTERATAHAIAHVLCMAFVWCLHTNCMQHCGSCTQVLQFLLTNTIPSWYSVKAEYGLCNFRGDHGCTLLLHCATAHATGRVQGILLCAAYDYHRTMLMLQLVYHAWLCVGPAVITAPLLMLQLMYIARHRVVPATTIAPLRMLQLVYNMWLRLIHVEASE